MNKTRFNYDLGHYSFQSGQIGCLQTLSVIPVVAGDKMAVNMTKVFRLSPLRRNLTMDARVDMFAFYVPHRQVYGDDWLNFIKEGIDESTTFPTVTMTNDPAQPWFSYMGQPLIGNDVVPLAYVAGYNRIWNRYFRHPTDDPALLADTALPTGGEKISGRGVAHLPTPWNTGNDAEVDASDLQVSTAGDLLDLTEFAQQQARLVTERRREFYSQRYNDVLLTTFGSSVNIDADERPELCHRSSFWLSGYDVDGTDDAALGQYSGKAAGVGRLNMRKKMFPEHGLLWIMAVLRFPPVHEKERHFLLGNPQWSYKEVSGDPDVLANEPPETLDLADYFNPAGGASFVADAGINPYGQWYRWQPNAVNVTFDSLNGYCFLRGGIASKTAARYLAPETYNDVFQTTQAGHWQSQGRLDCDVDRVVPPVEASIFAGTR